MPVPELDSLIPSYQNWNECPHFTHEQPAKAPGGTE